ncbi:putative polynucleotidyl transferase [Rosellinia necatrix]|uniref:Putative polynucleotidyl transferase n=1 Tax=Rosellinia necatrix TaxID=77044 RepID=A0A1W2TCR2_ROSNE|nr:putative polynucleotidyl transferase [Rosellinia necatrix]
MLPSASKNGLEILREALGLTTHSLGPNTWAGSILISIDFENTGNIRSGFASNDNCQVGLATLDTGDLQKDYSPKDLITTYNFITGSNKYQKMASGKFLFGESSVVQRMDLLENIQSIILQNRRVIIIGHAVDNEILLLDCLGFRFPESISVIIDTRLVAMEVFGFGSGVSSLRALLRHVRCPYGSLHSGGNDACFTLRASILLALSGQGCENIDATASDYLRQISTGPIPCPICHDCEAITTARRKERKPQKPRAKTEKQQDRIRMERAARRAEYERTRLL